MFTLLCLCTGCLDTVTTAQQLSLTVFEEEKEKQATTKVYTKEDFATVNRFESKQSSSRSSAPPHWVHL